jgi:6-phosphogluconolactonase/glucosamine-6-phosphate isomerase/deaminase
MKIERFADRAALNSALAERLKRALEKEGEAVMLSGGHAPRPAYELLGASVLRPSKRLHVLYSDERYVAPTAEASNYRASLPLLKALSLTDERVLRVRTESPLDAAVAEYDQRLRDLLSAGVPIRLGLLGMGGDGHTASLFSMDDLERAWGQFAIAAQRPDGMAAITVTPALIGRIDTLLMIVIGAEKRAALAAFLARDSDSIAWRAVAGCRNIEVWFENIDV